MEAPDAKRQVNQGEDCAQREATERPRISIRGLHGRGGLQEPMALDPRITERSPYPTRLANAKMPTQSP